MSNTYGEDDKCQFCIALGYFVVVCVFFFHLCNKQMSEQIKQQRCTYLLYLRAGLTVQFNHDVDFLELHPVMV